MANGDITNIRHQTDIFTRIVLSICASLIGSGVIALWQMSSHVAQLDERMAGWTRSMTDQLTVLTARDLEIVKVIRENEKNINSHDAKIEDLGRRLDRLERAAR